MNSEVTAFFPNLLPTASETEAVESDIQEDELGLTFFPNGVECESESVERTSSGPLRNADTSDDVLLERLARGDRESLALLFRRHAASVRHVAYRILRDEAEADDLLQDVFLFLFRRAALFDPSKSSAKSWIIQMAYHRAFDRRRYLSARHFYRAEELKDEVLNPSRD
ncbi:MAG TPA: sigma-70 family RNA polymerase sigma factor, partial [Granulicella sp.]|nr:sigma-70 family RNA polymerase sigma factor [Granulicella sp.]